MKKILTAIAVVGMLVSGGVYAESKGDDWVPPGHRNSTVTGDSVIRDSYNDNRSYANDNRTYDNDTVSRSGLLSGNNGDVLSNNTLNSNNTHVTRGGRLVEGDVNNGGAGGNARNVGIQGQVGIVTGGDQRNTLRDSGNSTAYGGNVYIGGGEGEGQGGRTLSPTARQSQSLDGNNSSVGDVTVNMPGELNRDLSTTVLDSRDLSTSVDDSDVSVDASNNSVYYEEAQKRNPVSTAYAAPLVTSNDTCMGSTSAGGQGITLGLSFATTWTDKDCIIRKDARFLHNAQHQAVALGLMCEKDAVRRAVARAGSVEERLQCGLNEDGSDPADERVATNADDYDVD